MKSDSEWAPIAFFAYKRTEHTKLAFQALAKNHGAINTDIYIFSDAAKNADDKDLVDHVRKYIRTIKGFKSISIIERDSNFGLANSIITGVSDIVNKRGKVIVLEDDLVVSPYFLEYMNDALLLYKDNDKVACIHGYTLPLKTALPETFFLRGADCWGWATWDRAWKNFEPDGSKLLREIKQKHLTYKFDFNGSYPYRRMLRHQVEGKIDSWAIRWYASAFLAGQYTLYPGVSLVENIGIDGSGTHCSPSGFFKGKTSDRKINLRLTDVTENILIKKKISWFYRKFILYSCLKYLSKKIRAILK